MNLALLHGMGRTAWSMRRLGGWLESHGYRIESLGYLAAVERVDRILDRIQQGFQRLAEQGPYAIIGHSLGGLLARLALARQARPQMPPARLIMLGTPNQPPRLARRFQRLWPYRWVNGECGRLLAEAELYASILPPDVPYTIIAGTGGSRGRWSPFDGDPNDGVVSVSETLIASYDRPILLPVRHTFMMNDSRVRAAIRQALEDGSTPPETSNS